MANDRNYGFSSEDRDRQDYGRDYGSGRDYTASSAHDYRAAGDFGGRDERNFRGGGTGYGERDRPDNWGGRETYGSGNQDYYGGATGYGSSGGQSRGRDQNRSGYGQQASGGGYGGYNRQTSGGGYGGGSSGRDSGRSPQGYDPQDRGFIARAGDEVRSWFGDEEAERRRDRDQRYDQAGGGVAHARDEHYHNWRRSQIDALDRDYHEYRQENAKKFESEFGAWRTNRQTQRASLGQVKEHMDVVGSDGGHVGTVDKVRGDRIVLTKNDSDAGGRHHSIPSSWLQSVDDKVTISKTADEAHKHWRDEEQSSALFGSEDRSSGRESGQDRDGNVNLNRSFSGTY